MNLQEATDKICEIKGELVALDAVLVALAHVLPVEERNTWRASFERTANAAATVLLHADISEHVIDSFNCMVERWQRMLTVSTADAAASRRQAEEAYPARGAGPQRPG